MIRLASANKEAGRRGFPISIRADGTRGCLRKLNISTCCEIMLSMTSLEAVANIDLPYATPEVGDPPDYGSSDSGQPSLNGARLA